MMPYKMAQGVQVNIEIRRNGSPVYTWHERTDFGFDITPLLSFDASGMPVPLFRPAPAQLLAAAVNQDGTINSRQNPAPADSVVTVLATGFGDNFTTPPVDGMPGNGSGWRGTMNIRTPSGGIQPVSIATIPGITNAVVAVKFRVPDPGANGVQPLAFGLATGLVGNFYGNFIYTSR